MQMVPFDKRDGYIWFNGSYKKWKESNIHILNHGLHYGSCVFEGIRIYEGRIFKFDEHIQRLYKSASLLDLKIPYTIDEIKKITVELTTKQDVNNGYIRPVVWRGSEKMAISAMDASTNVAIAAWTWPSYFSPEKIMQGINLTVANWVRPSPNSAPTDSKAAGLYMICSLSKHEAERKGFDDALMLDYRGFIAEATGANIFFIKNGKLYTPLPDCFLNGITRQCVIDIAKKMQIDVIEDHYQPNFLLDCNEAFLTGTAVEITPVISIDKYKFEVGKITKLLISEFRKLIKS
ncbi:MAG: branched-chain amino acid aminotransferase [Pseudomonadota bacterium]|nr:branched-chain amino acid aminotransferase [Pseudomonadota bacterium]